MKPYERRALNAYPYFKLAVWDERSFVWQAGKRIFPTATEAVRNAPQGARCRVSVITEAGKTELEPFVGAGAPKDG